MKYERLTEKRETPLVMSMWGGTSKELKIYNRLAELEDKIENGTLVELPCKVGDTVWCIYRYEDCFGRITDYFIEQDKAQCFIFDEGKFKIFPSNYNNRSEYYYKLKDIVLTKAEAEAKLKELKK